ncbi:MAG: hypothetical protein QOJ57_2567 [Thermoleophilaceae bacterium]|nr:hypothetical protein [Thermoleophilaceae bacterium]
MARRKARALAAGVAASALAGGMIATAGTASQPGPLDLTPVPAANTKSPGYAPPNVLSQGLIQAAVAQGSVKLENGTAAIPFYGYDGDGPMVPLAGTTAEATKTEPDKNTYLVLGGQRGADPGYGYGRHFLYQGHEHAGPSASGYITRINLDADGPHRVTLLADHDSSGNPLPAFDGSTWDPFARRLLFTAEDVKNGGVWQATPNVPSTVEDISGSLGRGGYEGIQNDSDGNLWLVEDVGGKAGATNTHAKQPNSFVYRFKSRRRGDLKSGTLQALQVTSLRTGQPIVFHDGQADADITSPDTQDLHTYGHVFRTRWITIHDTATDGSAPFSANALGKSKGATPFKRPENGVFKPGSGFTRFVFTETGDTNADTEAGAAGGGFGGLQELRQSSPSADTGTLRLLYQGDVAHTGFDNVQFASRDTVAVVEDGGDTLHTQRNALDSGYLLDTRVNYGASGAPQPVRWLAEGRDPSATIDSGLGAAGTPGFINDGDNEITGIHVSDGDPTAGGLLGAKVPRLFADGWRAFWTQQHGDNVTWELLPARERR